VNRFGIILTHNRPELLAQSIAALRPQVDTLLILDNASEPAVRPASPLEYLLLTIPDQPPNLSRLWARGLATVRAWDNREAPDCHVAIICDDAIVPPGWFDAVSSAMTEHGAVAGSSNPWGTGPTIVKREPDRDIVNRMPGWAFILDVRAPVQPDERFHWWYCDTDLDWQARAAGGMVMVGGCAVPNVRPNEFTVTVPGLNERAGQDGLEFAAKYGATPW
jgi:GT2 family glycosyltransferase